MKEFWNKRYAEKEMAYGEEPNVFFASELAKIKSGNILMPAEGEGRNAVYAAKAQWNVSAFDLSKEGKSKADILASKNNITIDYKVEGFEDVEYPKEHFDCIGLIYAHVPAHKKSEFHKILDTYLKKGGIVIFEAFSKRHLEFNTQNPKSGGPKNIDMLFSIEEIKKDFSDYNIMTLVEEEVTLSEGLYHNGKSAVIRFVGQKR